MNKIPDTDKMGYEPKLKEAPWGFTKEGVPRNKPGARLKGEQPYTVIIATRISDPMMIALGKLQQEGESKAEMLRRIIAQYIEDNTHT